MNFNQKLMPEPALRLSHRDFNACANALSRLYAAAPSDNFPQRLLEILFELVPSEHVSYNEFNEREPRYVAISFPERLEIQHFVPQIEKHLATHPLIQHVQQAGLEPKKISDEVTLRQFKKTALYQEYYRHIGTKHQMLFFLRGTPGTRIGLALNRNGCDFSERDRSVLAFLSPHVSQAYENARIVTELASSLERVGEGLGTIRRAIILTDAEGKIRWQSPLAIEWFKEFFPEHLSVRELPPKLKNWMVTAEQTARAGPLGFSELEMPVSQNSRLLVYCGRASDEGFVIALLRERTWIDATMARHFDLTPREAEILFWLSEAKTNPEITAIIGAGLRTVHKHVEHVFAKLGVENRLQAQRVGWELRRM